MEDDGKEILRDLVKSREGSLTVQNFTAWGVLAIPPQNKFI
jgi:hypothetical protein